MKIKLFILMFLSAGLSEIHAQIVLLNTYNPPSLGIFCGVGYDAVQDQVWVYECFSDSVHCLSGAGVVQYAIAVPGGSANDVDVETLPGSLNITGTVYPSGQLLFLNGETNEVEIYVVDNATGTVADTLPALYGNSHVVGGSCHPQRNSFFLIQDNVPPASLSNRIAEIDPVTGDTLQTFPIGSYFDVSYGDLEVGSTGNLLVISSLENRIAEFSPVGGFVQMHQLPAGVDNLSGIALDCDNNKAWVVNTNGEIFHLGQFPCNTIGGINDQYETRNLPVYPNPSSGIFRFTREIRDFSIYDNLGDLVHRQSAPAEMINLENFPDGIYLLRMDDGGTARLLKF